MTSAEDNRESWRSIRMGPKNGHGLRRRIIRLTCYLTFHQIVNPFSRNNVVTYQQQTEINWLEHYRKLESFRAPFIRMPFAKLSRPI